MSLPARAGSETFLTRLGSHGDRTALLLPDRTVTYRDLAEQAAAFAAGLGDTRRLVLLTGGNDLPSLVAYLGVLSHGHVALVASPGAGHLDRLVATYRPDAVVDHGVVVTHAEASSHDLHPDLALLLSTSGSTGSPKLVRLSHRNLDANAAAIADYLAIAPEHVAATTLPPHYCYGLSVLHSHLRQGAAVLLTDHSVVDPCFWEAVREHRVTSFAGVPHTFDLLDRISFETMDLPHLRQITQAGGRMPPEQVRRYATLGRQRGFDLVVMYGATEATARMAWLPPHLASTHPDAIGVPIPGGRFDIVETDGPEHPGELIYHGPNVMMGYAEGPADLALGHTVGALHTGDLARVDEDGLYRIVGRRARITKVLGLRFDLDEAERALAAHGLDGRCADGGDRLVVATTDPAPGATARIEEVARTCWRLPASALAVVVVAEYPRLANDKIDHRALASLAATPTEVVGTEGTPQQRIATLYRLVLRRSDVSPDDSFVDLGGDSLSYVEASLQVEEILGQLPPDWHLRTVRELGATARASRGPRRWRSVETSVLLRAVAITAVVATHGNLLTLLGGAHLLLAVSGHNHARFSLGRSAPERLRRGLQGLVRIVVPAVAWIGMVTLLFGTYPWRTVFLVNGLVGPPGWSEPAWHFWFLEALVAILAVLTLLSCVPLWRRIEARWPFWLPVALAVAGLVTRYELWEPRGGDDIHRAHMLVWLFAIGWASARAEVPWQRWLLTALLLATVPGFFDNPAREAFVVIGLLALVWVRQIRLPAMMATSAATLASASLYIYLTHWQIYPLLEDRVPLLALLTSLAVGIVVAELVRRIGVAVALTTQRTASSPTGSSTGPGPLTSPTRTRVPTG